MALNLSRTPRTVAELEAELREELTSDPALDQQGISALERSFGAALVERAAIDALCRARRKPFAALVREDQFGLEPTLAPAARAAYSAWLLGPHRDPDAVAVRHTVGLGDPLGSGPWKDGRPVGLADVIASDGVASFKVKLPGSADEAVDRLQAIAAVLDAALPSYRVTLDANEAYGSLDAFGEVVARVAEASALRRFWTAVAFIEQPLRREAAFAAHLERLGLGVPVIIDESDDGNASFARALSCGYGGVSVKTCKGVLHGLRNLALARERAAFMTMEDLSVQPGIALQQNLALAACLDVPDCERNGHHYGPGPASLPPGERAAFEAAHPDLYSAEHRCLVIRRGRISLRSTRAAAGFGTAVEPSHPLRDQALTEPLRRAQEVA